MPQFLHPSDFVKWFRRLFSSGVNTDVRPEMLKDGLYTDALNMRPASVDGNTGGVEAIRGEEILYPADASVTNPTTYECIGARCPNGNIVEFWCSTQANIPNPGDNPPYVRVNGVITAMSPNIPYRFDRPLQIAVEENCGDRMGVLYPADHWSNPLYWDVKSMLDNLAAGTQLYFGAYTTDINSVGLNAPPTIPTPNYPECIVDVGGTVGLFVGQYAYSVRYVDLNGNRTNWSPETGLIPIPDVYAPNNVFPAPNYPHTIGGVANILVPSQYGIVIQFRVDNFVGYASLEIKRRAYNDGQGVQGLGIQEIVARIPLTIGQLEIITYTDPGDSNINPPEVVPPGEAVEQLGPPLRPKGVDISDRRLKYANGHTEEEKVILTFLTFAGKKMTAITKALTRLVNGNTVPDGYDNPYNCAVNKSAQRGGQAKYGMEFWNGGFWKFPVADITEPFTPGTDIMPFPQRRDIKGVNGGWGADSSTYSEGGPIIAANVDVASQTAEGPVGDTFDAFSQGAGTKTDTERVTNVAIATGSTPGTDVGRSTPQFYMYGTTTPQQVVTSGAMQVPSSLGYRPWDPRDNQAPTPGFNVPPNTSRYIGAAGAAGNLAPLATSQTDFLDQCFAFNPQNNLGKCMAPTHHALGAVLAGVDSGIPTNAKIMSVVYNGDTRGEVVAQGFGSWDLQRNPSGLPYPVPINPVAFLPSNKNVNNLRTFFPDQAGGLIDQALWEDIQQNPGNYKIRFVCPLPFYPEVYAYSGEQYGSGFPNVPWANDCTAAHLMEVMCHTAFQHDEGQVNVGEGSCGYHPTNGSPAGNYPGFDKWRYDGAMDGIPSPTSSTYSFWQQEAGTAPYNGQGGNALFDLTALVPVTTGRATYYRMTTAQPVYAPGAYTIGTDTAFNDTALRLFHAPCHVINIIRVGATIPDTNVEPYKNMGCHIALSQAIGFRVGTGIQDFRLIGEREHYDCTNFLGTDYRYAYSFDPINGERRYLCVTGNTVISVPVILLAIFTVGFWIAPDGGRVYGLYDAVINDTGRYIQFGSYPGPDPGARIIIKYDKTAPIRVFGHDVTAAPVVHSVCDAACTRDDIDQNTVNMNSLEMLGGLPLPYSGFGMNPRWFVPEQGTQTEEQVWINFLADMRQWCFMWSAESRLLPSMYVNVNSTPTATNFALQYFPAVHYVARPMFFNSGNPYVPPTGFFTQYQTDYPLEWNLFNYGGLRFQPDVNFDYARQPDIDFFGYPKVGIIIPTERCTTIWASDEADPTLQDSPGLRTFRPQNTITLSEESGEIKVIATATNMRGAGQDQYVWFQSAVGRVLTNKNILTGASGEQTATYVISNYWGTELRISRNIGLPDQFWRMWAKGYATAGDGYADTFFWPDRKGWYRMRGDTIEDISRGKYLKKLLPILKALPSDYTPQMSAFYNTKQQEMWASINSERPKVLVFSPQTDQWLGNFNYDFDIFLNTTTGVVAMRDSETWDLDVGFIISGATREAYVTVPIVGDVGKYKEMVRWRVVGDKPDEMTLYDKDMAIMSIQSDAIQEAFAPGTGFLWAKLYDSFEGQWWRTRAVYDPPTPSSPGRREPQDVRFFVKVTYNTAADKQMTELENLLKNIR